MSESARVAELWRLVAREPDNDAPRQVLADRLVEHGDPRGEFIALQLAEANGDERPASKHRLRQLLSRHAREWLPPGVGSEFTFRRGFLDAAIVVGETDPEHREWDLVRELGAEWGVAALLPAEVRRLEALEELFGLDDARLGRVLSHGHPRLKALDWTVPSERFGLGFVREVGSLLEAVPALSHLGVGVDEPVPFRDVDEPLVLELVRAFGRRLTSLMLPARSGRLRALQHALREQGAALRLALLFERSARGGVHLEVDAAELHLVVRGEPDAENVDHARRVLGRAGFAEVLVLMPDRDDQLVVETLG